jgi:SNF2 family DNA or RNA helicase
MISLAQALPILEPLSQATEQVLSPLNLFDTTHLVVDLDDDAKFFKTSVRSLVPAEELKERGVKTHDGRIFNISWQTIPGAAASWHLRCPEHKTEKGAGFGDSLVAATDFSALVMAHTWPRERILFVSEAAEIMWTFLCSRFLKQTKSLRVMAEYKMGKVVPELPDDFISHDEHPLLPYQRVPIVAFDGCESAALFMEQGTGKTAVVINRVNYEAMRKRAGKVPGTDDRIYRVLIACPKQVRMNWCKEFEKFSTSPGKVAVLRGGELKRTGTLYETIRHEADCAWGAVVISLDSVDGTLEALRRVKWDLVVIDESHSIKSKSTQRWKSLIKLRDQNVRQRMLLTGTPIANSVMDLWAQLEFLGEGLSGFQKYENYRAFHGKFKQVSAGGTSIAKLIAIKNMPLLQERLARLSFMITKKEAGLDLPDKVYDIVEVEMTSRQTEWYRKVAESLVIELENFEEKKMTVNHVLTSLLRLAQITSGHVKWDRSDEGIAGEVEQIEEVNPKVEEAINLIKAEDRDPNGKTIIWACFREDIRVLCERLEAEGIGHVRYDGSTSDKDRDLAVLKFNTDPNTKVFVANPATAGSGLNLLGYDPNEPDRVETYCDHEIFFSQGWSAVQRSQAEDRAHRKGTRTNVRITDLVVPGTIDEEIRSRVLQKITTAMQIQDVREILKSILNGSNDE